MWSYVSTSYTGHFNSTFQLKVIWEGRSFFKNVAFGIHYLTNPSPCSVSLQLCCYRFTHATPGSEHTSVVRSFPWSPLDGASIRRANVERRTWPMGTQRRDAAFSDAQECSLSCPPDSTNAPASVQGRRPCCVLPSRRLFDSFLGGAGSPVASRRIVPLCAISFARVPRYRQDVHVIL